MSVIPVWFLCQLLRAACRPGIKAKEATMHDVLFFAENKMFWEIKEVYGRVNNHLLS